MKKFEELNSEMTLIDDYRIGRNIGLDEDITEVLRASFIGECIKVGMYLAMSRQAKREGYLDVSQAYISIACEEANHASKFAEILGELLESSTKQNLISRVEAEYDATEGKLKLAKKAKALGVEVIHDTVHEMCKDEARHGKIFLELLNKYF